MKIKLGKQTNTIKSTQRFYVKSFFMALLFILLIVAEYTMRGWYFDEIIGVLSILYLIVFAKKIERRDVITLVVLGITVAIGLSSNLISSISNNIFSIGVDIVAETKLLFAFLAAKYFMTDDEKKATIDMLLPFSKLYVISSFVCSIISLFVDIGMSSSERYGVRAFRFIFDFNFQYVAVYMLVFGVIVCNSKMSEQSKTIYYTMAIISLLLATKAPPVMFSIIFVGLAITFKKYDHVPVFIIIIGIIVLIWAGWYQIETYLVNENSPRHLFFKYAFRTANEYFPLGSGFGTYGSDQAARNYSQLYYSYGFNKYNGMNPKDSSFLSDTFWPMAIAQFGWIGAILYITVYILIFTSLKNKNFSSQRKAFIYAAYLQYMIHAIGSAILSSSAGLIGFMAIAIFTVSQEDTVKKKSRIKINFR